MTSFPDLPDSEANAGLIAYLKQRSKPARADDAFAYAGWELHTHPDLISRLAAVASGRLIVPVYGVAVLVEEVVAAACAISMDSVLLRLPEPPTRMKPSHAHPPLTGLGWYSADAWQASLPHLVEAALRFAATLR